MSVHSGQQLPGAGSVVEPLGQSGQLTPTQYTANRETWSVLQANFSRFPTVAWKFINAYSHKYMLFRILICEN